MYFVCDGVVGVDMSLCCMVDVYVVCQIVIWVQYDIQWLVDIGFGEFFGYDVVLG